MSVVSVTHSTSLRTDYSLIMLLTHYSDPSYAGVGYRTVTRLPNSLYDVTDGNWVY